MRLRTFVSFGGRVPRSTFCVGSILVLVLLSVLFGPIDSAARAGSVLLSLAASWALLALTVKRLHDRDKSPAWLLLALVPLLGPVWLLVELACLPGTPGENRYGADPLANQGDYLAVRW